MEEFTQSKAYREAAEFHCPRYRELPALDLYMDQVLTLVESVLRPLWGEAGEPWVTGPMVNNYTKQGLLDRPVKKKYSREHLAYLIFICAAKQVLSIPDIQKLLQVQRDTYPLPVAYDYFCTELENALQGAFITRTLPEDTASRDTQGTRITRALVIALAQKVYLNKFLEYSVQAARTEKAEK